jgi:hypothetical protein
MALLCGRIDHNTIHMLGRWHSDDMVRYLHLQAKPLMRQFTPAMSITGSYSFLPSDTVPIGDYQRPHHSHTQKQKNNNHKNHPAHTFQHNIIIPHSVWTHGFNSPHPTLIGIGFRQQTAIAQTEPAHMWGYGGNSKSAPLEGLGGQHLVKYRFIPKPCFSLSSFLLLLFCQKTRAAGQWM